MTIQPSNKRPRRPTRTRDYDSGFVASRCFAKHFSVDQLVQIPLFAERRRWDLLNRPELRVGHIARGVQTRVEGASVAP